MLKKQKKMNKFCFGAVTYGIIEILYRGHTHWSMLITGGICFTVMCDILNEINPCSLLKKCIVGSIIISSIEFISGYIVNIILNLNVWDYSKNHCNILGQVCLLYSSLWALLMIPISAIAKKKKYV